MTPFVLRERLETEHSLPLPTRCDIHAYSMMERFCLAVDDDDLGDALCDALRGRGVFRRFTDRMQINGMAAAWYRYREAAWRESAVTWCEAHGIA
jgi:Uncharacterised protein family (UPF0158)